MARLARLRIHQLRALAAVDIEPAEGLNLLVGANGAGKTSVLEAIFLLSHGRSFRAGGAEVLAAHGSDGFAIHADVKGSEGRPHRLGLGREAGRWRVVVDGEARESRGALVGLCPAVCFEPGSHALIAAGSERRRRFLDWGVFHVEQDFIALWRRYQRALQQRNALLRGRAQDSELAPWEHEMAAAAAPLDLLRAGYIEQWAAQLVKESAALAPALGPASVSYQRGWPAPLALDEALRESRDRDRARGHTTIGAHRADWRLAFEQAPAREHLSRGQEKLAVLACVLAQGELYARLAAAWPIVCLDDLASELDAERRAGLVARLGQSGAQIWITGTAVPAELQDRAEQVFHVEQGRVQAAR
ncbi:MAG TPA: DNA replication/repair protein RecF [Rhodanobacteraceae bacterium]|nr:DNA replication/repair protein RecF [Rhodanobacteraceae bacterium]